MIDKTKTYSIKNRSASEVFYKLPDLNNLMRTFMPGETKTISGEELLALSYVPGGETLLKEYLMILEDEAKEELIPNAEPEYNLTEAEIVKLLTEGSNDELTDCLNFAPDGVKDLIKQIAIDLPLNDLNKCQIIKDILGFDVLYNINIKKEIAAEEDTKPVVEKKRISGTVNAEANTTATTKKTRKVANPSYTK